MRVKKEKAKVGREKKKEVTRAKERGFIDSIKSRSTKGKEKSKKKAEKRETRKASSIW